MFHPQATNKYNSFKFPYVMVADEAYLQLQIEPCKKNHRKSFWDSSKSLKDFSLQSTFTSRLQKKL